METRFVQLLRATGLPDPVRQYPVRRPNGSRARIDLAYPEHLLAVELEGDASHSSTGARRRDRIRQADLVALGWRVAPFGWSDVVHDGDTAVAKVRAALAQAR